MMTVTDSDLLDSDTEIDIGPSWWRRETADFGPDGECDFDVMEHPLLDEDDTDADAQERLRGAVQAARFRRLCADPGTLSAHPRKPVPRWFHGYCVENTLAMLDELRRRDITCRPVTGSNRQDVEDMCPVDARGIHELRRRKGEPLHEADDPLQYRPPARAEEAYRYGCQHHWVEAKLDGLWWTVDVAQYRYDELDGVPYIGLTVPEPYKTYPDSHEFAADYFNDLRDKYSLEAVSPSLHVPDRHPNSWLAGY